VWWNGGRIPEYDGDGQAIDESMNGLSVLWDSIFESSEQSSSVVCEECIDLLY
jgi:hypothetical protein